MEVLALIVIVAVIFAVIGYDTGHMHGYESGFEDGKECKIEQSELIRFEPYEIVSFKAKRFTQRGEHADPSELIRQTREEVLRNAAECIEDFTTETVDGWGFMAELHVLKRR